MSSDLILKIVHTLSFIIPQTDEKTAELNKEVKELLLSLN